MYSIAEWKRLTWRHKSIHVKRWNHWHTEHYGSCDKTDDTNQRNIADLGKLYCAIKRASSILKQIYSIEI